jgi:hypothetical protein
MTSSGSVPKPADRPCVLCGAPLIDHRPDARHCSPACRVESHRIRAILSGSYSGPYRSVKERLDAAQKAYKNALVTNDDGSLTGGRSSARTTAIEKISPRS